MIIENAFFKIPEVLMSYDNIDDGYEGNIVNLLMTAIVLEFNARNIDNPLKLIRNEKVYPNNNSQRCDMYVDYCNIFDEHFYHTYNIKNNNYIEAKYFGGINRNTGNITKAKNAGEIIYDIFRLLENTESNDGKYIFLIFNDLPSNYLAIQRRTNDGLESRQWLEYLLNEGVHQISFSLNDEPNTIKRCFKNVEPIKLNFQSKTMSIKPVSNIGKGFWCYLIKVDDVRTI